jgi:hypothetical protein
MPITVIRGPFCEQLFGDYIAHETENAPDLLVPIIMEDGSGNILPEDAAFGLYGVICADGQSVCCNPPTEVRFVNQTKTEIGYGPSLRAKHGRWPQVYLYYYNVVEEVGELNIIGVLTRVSIQRELTKLGIGDPEKIIIDHGGVATGIVKIV